MSLCVVVCWVCVSQTIRGRDAQHGSILANHIFAGERKESSAKAQGDLIHDFVLKWSFFSANVQQELTSMRAETLKYSRPPSSHLTPCAH